MGMRPAPCFPFENIEIPESPSAEFISVHDPSPLFFLFPFSIRGMEKKEKEWVMDISEFCLRPHLRAKSSYMYLYLCSTVKILRFLDVYIIKKKCFKGLEICNLDFEL